MNPVAFTIFGLEVRWYGILIATGVLVGIQIAMSQVDGTRKLTKDNFLDFMLIMLPIGVLFTRLYYVLFHNFEYYMANPAEILNTRQGGLAIHGGIIGGVLVGLIYSKIKGISFFYLFDIVSPGLAIAQSIGRWGNFINQEAHGGPTDLPWAINIDGVNVHPTFLYESILTFSIFLFLYFYVRKRKKFDGQMSSLYLILYSIGRFFIEGLRTDSLMFMGMRTAQIVSILGITIGLIIYVVGNSKIKNKYN